MRKKKDIETEINEFLNYFNCERLIKFLKDIIPLFELYDVEDEDDWVKDAVGEEDTQNVRLIRTVYLMSRIAENHSGALATVRSKFPDMWRKIEKKGVSGDE